jgi:serine protease Do
MRCLAFLVVLVPLGAAAQAPDFTALVRAESAAVVSIGGAYSTPPVLPDFPVADEVHNVIERVARGLLPDFDAASLGTGFIVTADGYIATAYHIVEEAFNEEVVVRLSDGREFLGRVVGMDRATDIGLIKITSNGLPTVRIGDPARLQPGEWVITIGTPFGFERTVAAGIVSTTSRAIPNETHIRFIQTDVAMNPGHSGGPLFNLAGEVVGVNSMIFSATGGSIGLSFAVPIDVAMKVILALRAQGVVTRGRIGVLLQEVTQELAQALRLPGAAGALITAVERQAPAERAGLRAGDVVTGFDGKPVRTHIDLLAFAAESLPGTAVALDYVRDGKSQRVSLRVSAPDDNRPRHTDLGGTDRLGFRLAPLPEAYARRMGIEGAVVVQRAEGAARRAGLIPGDIILSVNTQPVRGVEAFRANARRARAGDALALLVERGGKRAFVPLRMP